MSLVFYVPLVCALALAGGSTEIARRASPRHGSAALVASALTVAVAADTALGVLVGSRLLDAAPLAALLGWRAETPHPIPVPVPVALAAAGALAFVAVAGRGDWRRARRATRRLRTAQRHFPPGELIVVRSAAALAHAIPGRWNRPGRIVVSDGMLRVLPPDERRVLLAHERSHLRHRHDRYRRLVRLAAMINPALRPTVQATDFLLERWADEDAAREVGSRRLTARALARAAVAAAGHDPRAAQAAFAAQRVSSRVHALVAAPPRRGARLALVLAAALGITAALSAMDAAHDLAHLFDLLRGDG